jgi:hypothetical protein
MLKQGNYETAVVGKWDAGGVIAAASAAAAAAAAPDCHSFCCPFTAFSCYRPGMATLHHTPKGRGFDQSLIYFHHCNDYWTSTVSNNTDNFCSADSSMVDLWQNDGPATGKNATGQYEEEMFVQEATRIIHDFAAENIDSGGSSQISDDGGDKRLFLYYASHAPHTPMQVRTAKASHSSHTGPYAFAGPSTASGPLPE